MEVTIEEESPYSSLVKFVFIILNHISRSVCLRKPYVSCLPNLILMYLYTNVIIILGL